MPNPRKPTQLKAIAGTDQPCRRPDPASIVELPLAEQIPYPPDWLPNAHAIKEWDRLAPILFRVGLLTEGGLSALGHMCALHGKIVQLYAAGEAPNAALVAQHRALVNDFGLTPVAQGKVRGNGGEEKPGNKFNGLRTKPAG